MQSKDFQPLRECPFCGGNPKIKGKKIARVACSCTARTYGKSEAEAIAAWNRRVDARQLALKTRVCPMCEDCPDGCPVETPKDSRNIVTNADRIRSMSDEELAEVSVYSTTRPDFDEGFDGEWYECGNIETWHSVFTADLYDSPDDAISYVLEWLQQKEECHEDD